MSALSAAVESRVAQIRERFGISGSVLKHLAIISMYIDHSAASLLSRYINLNQNTMSVERYQMLRSLYFYMRRIGRLAFPIFCFLLVEGFLHTKSASRYARRLFLFALISEYPFDYALHHGQSFLTKQNVYFTLLIGLLVLIGIRELSGRIPLQLAVMSAGMIAANLLRTDYSYKGVFIIEMLYIMRYSRFWQSACGAAFMNFYEKMPTPLAFIPIYLYNGKRGRQHKYYFYIFYPAHLALLGVLTWEALPVLLQHFAA